MRRWKSAPSRLEAVADPLRPAAAALPIAPRPSGSTLQENGPIRHAAGDRDGVELADQFGAEPAGRPLVGDGRVDEAVADDVPARLERRARSPVDQLGAGGAEQQQLGSSGSSARLPDP